LVESTPFWRVLGCDGMDMTLLYQSHFDAN
jgi:hypothetical protein